MDTALALASAIAIAHVGIFYYWPPANFKTRQCHRMHVHCCHCTLTLTRTASVVHGVVTHDRAPAGSIIVLSYYREIEMMCQRHVHAQAAVSPLFPSYSRDMVPGRDLSQHVTLVL